MEKLGRSVGKCILAVALLGSLFMGGYIGIHHGLRAGALVGLFIFAVVGGFDMLWIITRRGTPNGCGDDGSQIARQDHIKKTENNPTIR